MSRTGTVWLAQLFTRYPVLGRLWSKVARVPSSGQIPWTPIQKPLQQCRVCLVTTAGLHPKNERPFNMSDPDGDPTFRVIPATASREDLTITHDYYDHREADRDQNIVFPWERVRELVTRGILGGTTSNHFSFMGHIDGKHVQVLEQTVLPELLKRLLTEAPDVVLLTPA